jgi:DNA-binding transcriptional LysR family regulator
LRSAADLESRLRRIATGYEAELRLVHDSLLPAAALVEHIRAFEALNCGTRLRLGTEVMTGAWEALREGPRRSGPGDRRPAARFRAARHPPARDRLRVLRRALACAGAHRPSARRGRPARAYRHRRRRQRAPAAGAQHRPGRRPRAHHRGQHRGQDRLQSAGLGYGYLPRCRIATALKKRELVALDVVAPRPAEPLWLAWSADDEGEALKWWRARLQAPDALAEP